MKSEKKLHKEKLYKEKLYKEKLYKEKLHNKSYIIKTTSYVIMNIRRIG